MINFNVPPFTGKELDYMKEAVGNHKICGDGPFTKKCDDWMEERFNARKVLLTTSGSSALDMAALLCGLKPGDEVILPSFTFSSTANSFVLAGAKLVFVDVRPDTMNIDETKIEVAITDKTKVICPVHYAGVACEMDVIMAIAKKYNLMVVEDAAQGVMSTYNGRALGTIGDFGCFSFHETKNYSMGEGGAILINNPDYIEKAEILREKGTNRAQFFRGEVAKYNWVDFGDSYLQSDLNAAYLWAQLEMADKINDNRLATWSAYYDAFKCLEERGIIVRPTTPKGCVHNAHMFYLKTKDLETRQAYIRFMKENEILCVFHYVPLHSAPAGIKFGRFVGEDEYTTPDSDRLVRLPMYYNIDKDDLKKVIDKTLEFFEKMYMDKILGKYIYLRPITLDDTDLIVKWRNANFVKDNFIFRDELTAEMHVNWMEYKVKKGNVVQYIICEPNGNPVGSVYYRDIDHVKKCAEFGVFIGEEYALGKGYGQDATSLFVNFGFNSMGLEKILLRVTDKNDRAINVYEKVGFKKLYEETETSQPSGEVLNVVFMEINKV